MPSARSLAHSLMIATWLALLLSCSPGPPKSSISQAELAERIGTPGAPLIIDVRTPAEFDSGHIPGAVNIPDTQLPGRLRELGGDRDREIVVYCETGGRSTRVASSLHGAGFSRVLHLEGDMRAWRAAHLRCVGC